MKRALVATCVVCPLVASVMIVGGGHWRTMPDWVRSALRDAADDARDSVLGAATARNQNRQRPDPVSPFEDVEWMPGGRPKVQVGGVWYTLVAIDGWDIDPMLAFIDREFGASRRRKRFEEDLAEVLARAERPVNATVVLRVRRADGDEVIEVTAAMTAENRRRLWKKAAEARDARPQSGKSTETVDARTLRAFAALLVEKHSYSVAAGQGEAVAKRAEAFLAKHPDAAPSAISEEMAAILGESLDGHAELTVPDWSVERPPFVPALLHPIADTPGSGIVGVAPDRSGLLDPQRPYVMAINGKTIETLIARAGEFVADGSPALVRERACRLLRSAWLVGSDDQRASVTLSLAATPDAQPGAWRELEARTVPRKPIYGEWPRSESALLANGTVGYLRLASMEENDASLAAIRGQLALFASCASLVIDVRGNGGGSRAAMLAIAGSILPPTQPFVVYNVARALRMGETDTRVEERMASRFMVPRAGLRGDEALTAQALIDRVRATSKAPMTDEKRFSDWFVGIVRRDVEHTWWKPGCRVIVLMDNVCFSATDVFLMAMAEIEGVTLLGRPSAGGSGLAQRYDLPGGVRVRLSSMVSFQPDGGLVDGRGVQPDVAVWPTPADFVVGGSDTVLEAALKRLSSGTP